MSMDLQVRYDVLLRENSRLRAQIEHLVKELAGLRAPAPGIIPKTFGASEAQDRLNRTLTADLNAPRCGDHVLHRPSGERWMVAYADADQDTIAWTGWPDGRANLSDCEVVYRCTDEEHRQAVEQWRAAQDSSRRTKSASRGRVHRRCDGMQAMTECITEDEHAAHAAECRVCEDCEGGKGDE